MTRRKSFPLLLAAGCLFCAAASPVVAQVQVQINKGELFFGNNGLGILQDAEDEGTEAGSEDAGKDLAGPHVLEFSDGTELHGAFKSLDGSKGELSWQRSDVSAPLIFPTAQIRRISVAGTADGAGKVPRRSATVKLAGADWLNAELLTLDATQAQLRLGGAAPLTVDRRQVEWILFGPSTECYVGPTSLAGWSNVDGWSFAEGALTATGAAPIARQFKKLPDMVEYQIAVDQQTDQPSFTVGLHGPVTGAPTAAPGPAHISVQGPSLRVWMSNRSQNVSAQEVNLAQALRGPGGLGGGFKWSKDRPVVLRFLEDAVRGRFIIVVDGHVALTLDTRPVKPGQNRGALSFQFTRVDSEKAPSISKIRVLPWDGQIPNQGAQSASPDENNVVLIDGQLRAGQVEAINADELLLRTGDDVKPMALAQVSMVRLRPPRATSPAPALFAQLELASGGQFNCSDCSFAADSFTITSPSLGSVQTPLRAALALSFVGTPWIPPATEDRLLFTNGDELRGVLADVHEEKKIAWNMEASASQPLQIDVENIAGIQLAKNEMEEDAPEASQQALVRLRNGDLLAGELVTLDAEQVVIDVPGVQQFSIPRDRVRALYFASGGKLPVRDGALHHAQWLPGRAMSPARRAQIARANPAQAAVWKKSRWGYFDGSYTLQNGNRAARTEADLSLGTFFEAAPQRLEFRFDFTASGPALFLSGALFSDDENPGYMMQLYNGGLNFYDMGRRQFGGMASRAMQFPFAGKLKEQALRRSVRLLADRGSGALTAVVDGVVIGRVESKTLSTKSLLGCGFTFTPQPRANCTISNLWIGPWDGRLPEEDPAAKPEIKDSIVLANGDEARGAVTLATPQVVTFQSEAGPLDLPVDRLTMLDFGGETTAPPKGTRLYLGAAGCLTVSSYRLAPDKVVTCHHEILGDITFPAGVVKEIAIGKMQPLKATSGAAGRPGMDGSLIID